MNKKRALPFLAVSLMGLLVLIQAVPVLAVSVKNPIGYNTFPELLMAIANGIAVVVGSLGVIMIIWAGILFLTSAGDPAKLGKAKSALAWAIAGIAIGISASGIIELIKKIMGTT